MKCNVVVFSYDTDKLVSFLKCNILQIKSLCINTLFNTDDVILIPFSGSYEDFESSIMLDNDPHLAIILYNISYLDSIKIAKRLRDKIDNRIYSLERIGDMFYYSGIIPSTISHSLI